VKDLCHANDQMIAGDASDNQLRGFGHGADHAITIRA
jgi:hypothetical protein